MSSRRAALGMFTLSGALAGTACSGPPRTGSVEVRDEFTSPLLAESRWSIFGSTESRFRRAQRGGLDITCPAGHTGWIAAKFLRPPAEDEDATDGTERLEWRAAVQRAGSWFVIAELGFGDLPLLVQATAFGTHLTIPARDLASRSGWGVSGQAIALDQGRLANEHTWRFERNGGEATLALERDTLWKGPLPSRLRRISFGETRTDHEHGGTLRLALAAYSMRDAQR